MIRKVKLEDAEALTEIYNHYIRTSGATFEEIEIPKEEMQSRIQQIHLKDNYPYIVFEKDGNILGYAYASKFRERLAYRFSTESTVYVHPDHFGKGLGKQLYAELIDLIKLADFHSIIGVITLPNDASIALHEKFGFKKVGHFSEVGFKFNQWMDVGFWELKI